jgi:crotonobetainyl-CoA:carnitine CoA-transferase CaiB-like acyl-CoA transferase
MPIIRDQPSYPTGVTLLAGIRVVSTALNLPGPVACARLRDLGATVLKIEPPAGDPFEQFCAPWYRRLHEDVEVLRLDLKSAAGRDAMTKRLEGADLLVTAQRAAALERLDLGAASLASRFPRLCHVAITGHAPPDEEIAGHDLTYLAPLGLVDPPLLPPTLFADMAGAELSVSTALALLLGRERGSAERARSVALADAAFALAQPLREGLTRPGSLLGGGYAGYNLYAASDGWIAVAVLEPRFAERLAALLGMERLETAKLRALFGKHDTAHWQSWAREHDLPIVAVRDPHKEKR